MGPNIGKLNEQTFRYVIIFIEEFFKVRLIADWSALEGWEFGLRQKGHLDKIKSGIKTNPWANDKRKLTYEVDAPLP